MTTRRGLSRPIKGLPDIDLHEHAQSAPVIAHRPAPVWDMGSDDCAPLEDFAYKDYRFLGRIAETECNGSWQALALARKRFHRAAKVFKTSRWYVAYRIL